MDNPYWKAEIKPHYLDRGACRIKCFDVFNIMAASRQLAREQEFAEPDEPIEPSSMFTLHHQLAERRLSQLLLDIAVFVRTFDDVMSAEAPEEYAAFAAQTNGQNFIGGLDGGDLNLREACNKIIHATDFRPVYEDIERPVEGQEPLKIWHMDGQIEIGGAFGKKTWEAILYVENFLEIVLDRIAFEVPEAGPAAESEDGPG